ncbi:MAG TPA: amino acid adenylation domain-containing protein [Flavobacterium sp.]|nr:amino acid adenylation domain-containing protein [Flavobacterium sp.]
MGGNKAIPIHKYWEDKLYGRVTDTKLRSSSKKTLKNTITSEELNYFNKLTSNNPIDKYTIIFATYNFLLKKLISDFDGALVSNFKEQSNHLLFLFSTDLNVTFEEYLIVVKDEILETLNYSNYDKETFDSKSALDNLNFLSPFGIEFKSDKELECNGLLLKFEINNKQDIEIQIFYVQDFVSPDLVNCLEKNLRRFLVNLEKNIETYLSDYSLLNDMEKQRILIDFNNTDKEFPEDKTIHLQFEEQVSKTPNRIALVYKEQQLTYKELHERSSQLALYIRERYKEGTKQELNADVLIGLCLDRSLEMVIGILAVLKAGGAYVPIDPNYPQERIDYILQDTKAQLVLCQRHITVLNSGILPVDKVIHIDLTEELYKTGSVVNSPQYNKSNDLAYVIYTSGTTGKPKGVMVEHAAVSNTVRALYNVYDYKEIKKVTAYTSYVFDVSVSEIFTSLLQGLELHILENAIRTDIEELAKYFAAHEINLAYLPPVLLSLLPTTTHPALKTLVYAGEPCDKKTAALWSTKVKLFNYYGPTEACIYASGKQIITDEVEQIGLPIQNNKLYILDSDANPVSIGLVGELYIGGAGLARGYLNLPDLTQERFVTNPFATQEDLAKGYNRLYKTGDTVRWLPDGNIEYLGRNDDQVKIRGYRIELGEIEQALIQIDGIKQACVLVREIKTRTTSTKYLVGYYVEDANCKTLDKIAIHSKLSQVLPEYMLPAALVEMESFPLTINGKLDKRALPDPDFKLSDSKYSEPLNELEKEICEIWQEILGLEKVGTSDDFFRIGGNSILGIQVSHRMSKALNCQVKIGDIFKHKTITQLLIHATGQSLLIIPKVADNKTVLSFAQERLWFIEQFEEGTNAYHMPSLLELDAETNKEGLKQAIQQIISRHEVLRSTIEQSENLEYGIQKVHETPLFIDDLTIATTEDYEALIKKDIDKPFNLNAEYPIRVKFYTLTSSSKEALDRTLMLINIHHIASDGWSMDIFQKELTAYYEAFLRNDKTFALPALEIQYKDYAVWQKNYLTGEVLEKQLSYWKNKLSGYEPLEFPTDYPRPSKIDYSGARQKFTVNKEISQKLRLITQEYGVTLNSVMLASVSILLSKYTGQKEIVIGSAIANRQHRQTEGLIGFFVNTQANRIVLSNTQRFIELIQQVHEDQVEAQLHQDLPFERLIDMLEMERDTSKHPVFQVMFGVQNFDSNEKASYLEKNYLKPYANEDIHAVEQFDFSISIDDSHEELIGEISYATSLFHSDTIAQLANHYLHLLDQLIQEPKKAYCQILLLNPVEYKQIVYDWNETDQLYIKNKAIHELFQDQVVKTPDAVAIVFEEQTLTYKELNEKSNQLARHIRAQYKEITKQSLVPNTLIGLYLDRSLEMVIGILAVLKAGGAYVPLDINYPKERIDHILEDTQAVFVLQKRTINESESISLPQEKLINIDLTEALYKNEDNSDLLVNCDPTNLAYVIYTSGTTGKPKGVMIEHKSVVNLIQDLLVKYKIENSERFLLFSNYVFDASVEQLFLSLLSNGGSLFIIDKDSILDSTRFIDYVVENKITHLDATPSYLSSIDPSKFTLLKRVVFGAEYLSKDVFNKYKSIVPTVINAYGPTETTVTALVSVNSYLLQKPTIQNTKVFILDSDYNPVPTGIIGELYIGGAGLARGYLNRPDLTQERFVTNPFATQEDLAKGYNRLYKTGDTVRWLPDGNIEYLGRNDDQVKIRGYRIELGEIEEALMQLEGIKQACVLVKEVKTESSSIKYLVGYYVVDTSSKILDKASIISELSKVLPEYMLPVSLIMMESFPLTINGKLDKRALPNPDFKPTATEYIEPVTSQEKEVCEIWEEILGLEKVGTTDNFFRIGGNSILAIQVSHRMSKVLDCQVKVGDMFKHKTIKGLVEHVLIAPEENVEWDLG